MNVLNEPLEYWDGQVLCEGHVALNTLSRVRRPCVLIAHAWDGPNEQVRDKASHLARMGYLGFALDVYGKGVRGGALDDNTELMAPYIDDRALLRRRLLAALAAAKLHPFTDPSRIAVIGYCFGGAMRARFGTCGSPGVAGRGECSWHVARTGVYSNGGHDSESSRHPRMEGPARTARRCIDPDA
jgi:dienelactone hydrolase